MGKGRRYEGVCKWWARQSRVSRSQEAGGIHNDASTVPNLKAPPRCCLVLGCARLCGLSHWPARQKVTNNRRPPIPSVGKFVVGGCRWWVSAFSASKNS